MLQTLRAHSPRFFLALLAGILLLSPPVVHAEVSAEKLESIKTHCAGAQSILQQSERRDAVSRINRGRAYDLLLRQVSAMNSRFTYNKIPAEELPGLYSDLQVNVESFRAAYARYDQVVSEAITVNCQQKPADFSQLIERARLERQVVGDNVSRIEALIASYRDALVRYQERLPSSGATE